ncbi:PKD-like family lipoprotein [Chitinophaga lutea]
MKIKISFVLCACWLLLQTACVKDNSVVQVRPVDSIRVTGLADVYSVSIDEQLAIKPAITSGFTPESNMEFLWYAYNNQSVFVADTLSKSRDLAVPVTMSPGNYTLVFRITDKTTGVFYKTLTTLSVVNDYTTGLLVLTETGGEAGLHFLNTVSGKFIEDAYGKGNGGEDAGKAPVCVAYHPQASAMPAEILMLCADERGGVVINPVTFKKERDIRNAFIVPWQAAGVINVQTYVPRASGLQDYLVIDGQAHNRATNAGEVLFRPPMLGDYSLSTVYFNEGASRSSFYDNKNMRFLCHNNTSGSLNPFLAGTTTSIIDPNAVGLKVVYGGRVSGNEHIGVFENADKSVRYLLRFLANGLAQTFTAKEKFVIAADKILQAEKFASSSTLQNYLLYNVGSDIYAYNSLSRSGGWLMNAGTAFTITFLKMNGSELQVGYVNPALPGKKGGFATYEISTLGGLNARLTRSREGFCDRVVDITNKQ